MMAGDGFHLFQVGQGAGDLEQAMGRPQRQRQPFAGAFQPAFISLFQFAVLAYPRQVEKRIGAALAPLLAVPGIGDEDGGAGGVITGLYARVQRGAFPGDGHVQVDPVQQRPREFVAIALNLLRRAATAPTGLAHIAARAGVHCRHQLKARRETHPVAGAGNHDMPGLQRLTQHLQDLAIKLRY